MGRSSSISSNGRGVNPWRGGRGILPALFLYELERTYNCSLLREIALTIAGTSSGALTALASLLPVDADHPTTYKYSAQDVVEIYNTQGQTIFSSSIWRDFISMRGWNSPKYDRAKMDAVLQSILGKEIKLSSLYLNQGKFIGIPYVNASNMHPGQWESYRAATDAAYNPYIWEAAGAATAAPTYVDPATVTLSPGRTVRCLDGGAYLNNPLLWSSSTLHLAGFPLENQLLISLGTGVPMQYRSTKKLKNVGVLKLGRGVIDFFLIPSTINPDLTYAKLLGKNFFSKQYYLHLGKNLDEVNTKYMDYLTACFYEGWDKDKDENVLELVRTIENARDEGLLYLPRPPERL